MGEFIWIYSDGTPGAYGEPSTTAPRRAAEVGATWYEVSDVDKLRDLLISFKGNTDIDRLVLETHGSPGAVWFGSTALDQTTLGSFRGKGLEDIFTENARIFLNGCNIASTGQTCGGTSCTMINGRALLEEMARVFLFKGGGRVGASTSLGHVMPFLSNKVIHLPSTYYVYINKGGTKVRLAKGSELGSPEGDWFVPEDRNRWMYRFYPGGEVRYQDENGFWAKINILSLEKQKGQWTRENGGIKVSWPSGTTEVWDLPLFEGYQPVTWKRFDGRVQDLIATRTTDSGDHTW